VLPKRFVRLRHYGLFANAHRSQARESPSGVSARQSPLCH
jgi:hypothetical protein